MTKYNTNNRYLPISINISNIQNQNRNREKLKPILKTIIKTEKNEDRYFKPIF